MFRPLPSRSEATRLESTKEEESEGEEGRREEQLVQEDLDCHILSAVEGLYMAFEESIPIVANGAGDQASEEKEPKRSFAVAPSPRTT